ncbi:MAG: IS110 family transposase [Gemmatimonadales bacterium]
MDTIGLDLHKRESQLCCLTEEGEIVERRIVTSRERFTAVVGGRPRARILLEASTESEWVARHLEALGHEVIVADPNFAPMYATRSRRVKTDRRDARTLAEACRLGAYRPAHRASDAQRHVRAELAVRDALIRTRTRYVALTKALVRRDGLRLPSGGPEHTDAKLAALPLPPALAAELAPLRALWEPVNTQIAAADARLGHVAASDSVVARLMTAPSIGPVTAVAFVATLDDVTRFASAHQVAAYLGLTPREYSSGDNSGAGGSARPGMHACATCWSRRPGGCYAPRTRRLPRCGPGGTGSHSAVGAAWRRSRWRAGWPASSTRCGATGRTTERRGPPRTRRHRQRRVARRV